MAKKYAFDLDGTVTKIETLPLLAAELGLSKEMARLTDLTLAGDIPFAESFNLRYSMLKDIPVERIREIMQTVRLDEDIAAFIRENKNDCYIVTGNLDCWIAPIILKLGCRCYCSESYVDNEGKPVLKSILDKSFAIQQIKLSCAKVIAIGESFNDIPMFKAADVSVAYGGVHRPVDKAISAADYVVYSGNELCRLLKTL